MYIWWLLYGRTYFSNKELALEFEHIASWLKLQNCLVSPRSRSHMPPGMCPKISLDFSRLLHHLCPHPTHTPPTNLRPCPEVWNSVRNGSYWWSQGQPNPFLYVYKLYFFFMPTAFLWILFLPCLSVRHSSVRTSVRWAGFSFFDLMLK